MTVLDHITNELLELSREIELFTYNKLTNPGYKKTKSSLYQNNNIILSKDTLVTLKTIRNESGQSFTKAGQLQEYVVQQLLQSENIDLISKENELEVLFESRNYNLPSFTNKIIKEKDRLLRTYWNIPDRQIETSVVLSFVK